MYLTRLRVEQLRQFRQPLELAGLVPGLNLFSGPNEAGKSTLVRAIRAAFFERHRSTAVDDLRPWGDSAASPAIELDFMFNGQLHQLSKSFLGKKRCALRIGASQRLEGVEAEDHLAELLGFSFALKGASKQEHWGIPGLLWVEQGSGHQLDASHAREHLHDALHDALHGVSQGVLQGAQQVDSQSDSQAGGREAVPSSALSSATSSLAATGGDELLASLRAQRNELLSATGKPREALAKAATEVEALASQQEALEVQISAYRQQVDQLASLRAQQQAEAARKPWEALRQALSAAQAQQQALQQSAKQLADDQARLLQAEQTRQLLLAQLQAWQQQQAAGAERAQALAAAQAQAQAADAAVSVLQAQVQTAQARATAAREALRLARQEALRLSLQEQQRLAQEQLASMAAALARAEQENQRLQALRQAAAAVALNVQEMEGLRRLDRACREADLKRQAVATRLHYRLLPGQQVQLGTVALRDQGELLLDAPATLHLPGLGELTIRPGGQDLADLAQQHQAARDALEAALLRLGLADLAQAETRWAQWADLQAQIRLAEQALSLVAPQGLEPLRASAEQWAAQQQSSWQALAQLPPAPTLAEQPTAGQAEAEQELAARAEQQASLALAGARQQQAASLSRLEQAQRELAAAQALLADPERQQRLTLAQAQLLATGAERDALAARIAASRSALEAARPEIVAQDIQRLARSIEQQEQAHQQRREQILVLENSLQSAGVQGLDEQGQQLAGALALARRRLAELSRRAAALDLLCRLLEGRRLATLARLQAPLQQRLQHYLQLLLPGASLQLDEQLAPTSLSRPGPAGAGSESGPLAALSFGAREQLGLISRLAYADLLLAAGRSALLILDDALVHTDAGRLAQMKRVIFDAAQRHQVLLFTCHEEDWRDMGVAPRPIAATLR